MNKLSTTFMHRLCATPNSALNVAMYLRYSVRSMLVGEPLWRVARKRCLVLLAMLFVVGTTPAHATKAATTSIDLLKLYAHSRIINYKVYSRFFAFIYKFRKGAVIFTNTFSRQVTAEVNFIFPLEIDVIKIEFGR